MSNLEKSVRKAVEKALPHWCELNEGRHLSDCPAWFRESVIAAVLPLFEATVAGIVCQACHSDLASNWYGCEQCHKLRILLHPDLDKWVRADHD